MLSRFLLVGTWVGVVCCCISLPVHGEAVDSLGDRLPPGALARLGTSRLNASSAVIHPDGNTLFTHGIDGVRLWDAASGQLVKTISSANGIPACLSPDGNRLVVTGYNRPIVIYDVETGRPLCSLHVRNRISLVEFSPDGKSLLITSWENSIELWGIDGRVAKHRWTRNGKFYAAAFAPDGTWVAIASHDAIIRFDPKTGVAIAEMPGLKSRMSTNSMHVSPDGTKIATCGSDGSFRIWDVETSKLLWSVTDVHRLTTHSTVNCARFSPDGKTLATGGTDQIIRFWDVESHRQLRTFEDNASRRMRWMPDGKHILLFGGNNPSLRIRDAVTGVDRPDLPGHGDKAQRIRFIDDGKHLVSLGGNDNSLCVWNLADAKQLRRLRHPRVSSFEMLGDSNMAAITSKRQFSLYNVLTGEMRMLALSTDTQVSQHWWPYVSRDGKQLLAYIGATRSVQRSDKRPFDQDWKMQTWDVSKGQPVQTVPIEKHRIAISADGSTIVGHRWDSRHVGDGKWKRTTEIRRWNYDDLQKSKLLWEQETDGSSVDHFDNIAVSPDGRRAVLAWGKSGVLLLDTETGEELHHWTPPDAYFRHVAFVDQGRRVFAGSCKYHLWNIESGEQLQRIEQPEGTLSDVGQLSPDGRLLAMGDRDGNVSLWDMETGKRLVGLRGHEGTIRTLEFSPDGKTLASSADDTTILLWSLDPMHWPSDVVAEEKRLTPDVLWKQLGNVDAGQGYAAARELILRPVETLKLMANKLEKDSKLPANSIVDDPELLRLDRAVFVLQQIESDESTLLLGRINADDRKKTDATVALHAFQAWLHIDNLPIAPLPLDGRPVRLSDDGRFCLTQSDHRDYAVWEVATGTRVCQVQSWISRPSIFFHANGRHVEMRGRDNRGHHYEQWDILTGKLIERTVK